MTRARLIETVDAHFFRLANEMFNQEQMKQPVNISLALLVIYFAVQARANETADEHMSRLASDSLRHAQTRAIENTEVHISRLESDRLRHSELRARETSQEREARLRRQREAYVQRIAEEADFHSTINTFCDKCCDICQKKCYPNQSSKSHAPSKAYWNNFLPGDISVEIAALTEPERRLLQRIIPYVKVIKFPGRFGQYGFKGHATLFALNIFKVSEKMPEMLPRSSTDVGIVVVTETLENLNESRDYNISPDRVYKALD
ncbi:hypothetical protein AVEN_56208-1 [Araneus ventricosus]|uniref:DUF6570 domain-containing protein n=1 Tax=Araneus ventricosus TaxID=182803 RepID=A0A4Y2P1L1_ARAVE|nr:hypothetical protein AVEN_56208-1 [Araneus ventricosus]